MLCRSTTHNFPGKYNLKRLSSFQPVKRLYKTQAFGGFQIPNFQGANNPDPLVLEWCEREELRGAVYRRWQYGFALWVQS